MFTIIYIAQESTMALCHLTSMIRTLVLKYTCNHLVATHHSMKKEIVAYQSESLPLQQSSAQSKVFLETPIRVLSAPGTAAFKACFPENLSQSCGRREVLQKGLCVEL